MNVKGGEGELDPAILNVFILLQVWICVRLPDELLMIIEPEPTTCYLRQILPAEGGQVARLVWQRHRFLSLIHSKTEMASQEICH